MLKLCSIVGFLLTALTSVAQWPFKEESQKSNVVFRHQDPKLIGGGVVIFDFDNDGYEDIYLTGGLNFDGLYHNLGNGKFEDVSLKSGIVAGVGSFKTVGAVSGDLDNDGFKDLIVTTDKGEPNLVLKNINGSTFQVLQPFPNDPNTWSSSVILADCNKDSFLDVYILNYVTYTQDPYFQWRSGGLQNFFYQNNGNFQFSEITQSVNTVDAGAGLAGTFSDADNDGDPDLFVINDFGYEYGSNKLLLNEFPAVSFAAEESNPHVNAAIDGMGIAVGDYNEDGLIDYYISNFQKNLLLTNQGNSFTELALEKNIQVENEVSWGTFFFDYDNDTYLDLFVANGSQFDLSVKQDNRLFHQDDAGQFIDVTPSDLAYNKDTSRGTAYGDLNNDGYPDAVVVGVYDQLSSKNPALLYINYSEENNNWLKLKLEGTISNRDAYGAKVRLYLKDRMLLREVDGGSSYLSHNSSIVHFGLGKATKVDSLYISWPNGLNEMYYDLDPNKFFKAVENNGISLIGIVTGGSEIVNGNRISIGPNPFTDIIIISLGVDGSGDSPKFNMYNLIGQQINAIEKVERNSDQFDLHIAQSLKPDMYFLELIIKDKYYRYKIIKQH